MDNTAFGSSEVTLKTGKANFFLSGESVGGHLTLTSKRLIFKSHRLNFQRGILEIPLSMIIEVASGPLWNGITVKTNRGTNEKFVVYRRRLWIKLINDSRS